MGDVRQRGRERHRQRHKADSWPVFNIPQARFEKLHADLMARNGNGRKRTKSPASCLLEDIPAFIEHYVTQHGDGPRMVDMVSRLGHSDSTIRRYWKKLEKAGIVESRRVGRSTRYYLAPETATKA